MSLTKYLAKQLKTMSRESVVAEQARLSAMALTERNSCLLSSIRERIKMCERQLRDMV